MTARDYDDNTVQRAHDTEQPKDHFLTRRAVPHTLEALEFCEYDAKTKKNTSPLSCVNCANYNVEGANWCVECGTAVTGAKSQSLFDSFEQSLPSHSKGHSNSTEFNKQDVIPKKIHSSPCSNPTANSDVLGEISSIQRCSTQGHSVRIDFNHSRKKPAFSIRSPGQCKSFTQTSSGRCWSTSGLYLWRKPSSLKSMKFTLAEPGYQPNSCDQLHTKARNLACTVSGKNYISCAFTSFFLDSLAP